MSDFEQLLRRSRPDRTPQAGYQLRVLAAVDAVLSRLWKLVWRWLLWLGALGLVFLLLTLPRTNADLIFQLLWRRPAELAHLGLMTQLVARVIPWLSVVCLFGIALMLALLYRHRLKYPSYYSKENPIMKRFNLNHRLLLPGVLVAATALTATSAYAYYQTSGTAAAARQQLAGRIQAQTGVALTGNEADIPVPSSGVHFPDCRTSQAAVCLYSFSTTHQGEDVLVAPVAYFSDQAQMQVLGQQLFNQTKSLDGRGGRLAIVSSRQNALFIGQSVADAQAGRAMTAAEQAQMTASNSEASGDWDCTAMGGCALDYWPQGFTTAAASAQMQHIVYQAPAPMPTPTVSAYDQALAAHHIGSVFGRIVAVSPTSYQVTGSDSKTYTVQTNSQTEYRLSGDLAVARGQLQVGSIVFAYGRLTTDGKSEAASLIINNAGVVNAQGVLVSDFYGISLKVYADRLVGGQQ
jgi:hypothetical protein